MLIKIGAGFLAAFMGVFGAATVAVFDGGVAIVTVENDDVDLTVPLPMGLVHLALSLAPRIAGEPVLPDLSEHRDLLRTVSAELRRLPDATFIEVEDRGERVSLSKRAGSLVIDVRSDDEHVYVSLPVDATADLIDRVAG